RRVSIASTLGVYAGSHQHVWRENDPLPLTASFSVEAFKKAGEIFASCAATARKLDCVSMRICSVYGPMYDPARGVLAGRLVHAAVHQRPLSLERVFGSVYADDGCDQGYVKDIARGIALLHTAKTLRHRVYNVATGRTTTNQELVDAIRAVVPD